MREENLETGLQRSVTMPEENPSVPRRAAEWLLRRAVGFWPHESGKWGRALAAELPSTAGAWEAIRWTMGGLMVLMREWMRHAMGSWKRPIGVPAGDAGKLGRELGAIGKQVRGPDDSPVQFLPLKTSR